MLTPRYLIWDTVEKVWPWTIILVYDKFLAHMSRRLIGELKVYAGIRRLSESELSGKEGSRTVRFETYSGRSLM